MDSQCPDNLALTTENVITIQIDEEISWERTYDHSKYCLSEKDQHNLVCFSDMNRMESQRNRGGAAFCLQKANVWKAMKKLVGKYEDCPTVE